MVALLPSAAAGATRQITPLDALGSFANADASKTYLPGSNGAVAQDVSDKLFAALRAVLGGNAPRLNFVPVTDPDGGALASANPAQNQINLSASAMTALVDPHSQYHNAAVNLMPHEMMHLRQTAAVLADLAQREGGAQAFADLVASDAARAAHIPYVAVPGVFDGNYAPYVQMVNQKYGRDWIMGGQMGKPPVSWP